MFEANEWRNQVAHASSGVMLRVDSLVQLEDYEEWLKKRVTSVGEEASDAQSDSVTSEN